jgi:hypothetical protein
MKTPNLLPYDGYANYIPNFIYESNNTFFEKLLKEVNWKHDKPTFFGEKMYNYFDAKRKQKNREKSPTVYQKIFKKK